jgi:hypothetical protein
MEKNTAGAGGKGKKRRNRKEILEEGLRGAKTGQRMGMGRSETRLGFQSMVARAKTKKHLFVTKKNKNLCKERMSCAHGLRLKESSPSGGWKVLPTRLRPVDCDLGFKTPGAPAPSFWLLGRLPGAPVAGCCRRGGQGADPRPQGPTAARVFEKATVFKPVNSPLFGWDDRCPI